MEIKYNPVVPSFICRITQIISELFQLVDVSGLELQTWTQDSSTDGSNFHPSMTVLEPMVYCWTTHIVIFCQVMKADMES